jgi:AraC family transcriptional regulator
MPRPFRQLQPVLAFAATHLDEDLSLGALADQAGLSTFHLHRVFTEVTGETPKHFTLRLRLGRAAVLLLATQESVLDIALSCGFQSHEAFCRAFRLRFGIAPSAYRERGFVNGSHPEEHAATVNKISHCVGLYHISLETSQEKKTMSYTVSKKELAPQPVLVVRRKIKRSEIAATIGGSLPHVFLYAQKNGIALTGLPFTRYLEFGPGLITIEPGMRVAEGAPKASGDSEVIADTLPGGPAASTIHMGPYDKLSEAYGAIEQWMESEGLKPAGAPWESYLTDPGDYPDPKDWKTEVLWPLAR